MLDEIDDESDDDIEKEEFSGFSIVDESGLSIDEIKRVVREAEDNAAVNISMPVPDNEFVVILDNAADLFPQTGGILSLKFTDKSGDVYFNDQKIGNFKPAFKEKIIAEKSGQHCLVTSYCEDPPMVKLVFVQKARKGTVKIELTNE